MEKFTAILTHLQKYIYIYVRVRRMATYISVETHLKVNDCHRGINFSIDK